VNRIGILCSCFCLAAMCWLPAAPLPAGLRTALAEFESGARRPEQGAADFAIGARQEISRFQILPSLWRSHSTNDSFSDPEVAWTVAEKILHERETEFRHATGREWDGIDLFLMWNAPGAYRRANWDRTAVSRAVRERAERFANVLQAHQSGGLSKAVVRR
jgi:hypothetical protein